MGYGIHAKQKLRDKVESSWNRLSNHRVARERIWKAYIGDTHGLSPAGASRIPLNGHALYARVLIQYLAANQPKVMISTDVGPWKASMESLEYQVTRVMKEERFGFKQQRFVLDALLYSPGILSVQKEWRRVPQGNEGDFAEALKTTINNVDASDWGFDTAASSVWDADFTFRRVRMAVDDILDNPMFQHVDEETIRGMAGWNMGDDERLFFENDDKSQPYRDIVTLYEVYDRCQNRIKVYPVDGGSIELYNEQWDGQADGPYHYLDFLDVPNHAVGLSPLCMVHNLIEAMNRTLSKTIAQTDAAKNILRINNASYKAEAEALMESRDGYGVYAEQGIAEMISVGGPDGRTMAMTPILRDLFNWGAGNINELGGLGVSAPTATQGKLLSEAASGMVSFMQARTNEAVRKIAEAITHNELQDTVTTEHVPVQLADGQTFWRKFTPEQRQQIDSILVNTDIDVFSTQYRSPGQRLQQLTDWWNGFAMPAAPIAQQQGMEYDLQALNRTYAKMADLPEINDVTLYSMKPQPQGQGSSGPVPLKQSPVTTRTNVRMDRGGPSNELGGALAGQLAQMEAA